MATLTAQVKQRLDVILGSDLSFPIVGNFQAVRGLDLLLQDIQQLLLTIPGERVNRPNFGCTLRNQIWENIDTAAKVGQASISSALITQEPRITLISVTSNTNRNTGLITFVISFMVNNTNTSVNLVFPYRSATQIAAG